jgi:hypothetical protein
VNRIKRLSYLVVSLCVAAAGGLAAPAWADDTDTQFLADISDIGVPESPAQLIPSAHTMCSLYANGASESQVDGFVLGAYPHWSEG